MTSSAEYMRRWRRSHPEAYGREKAAIAARKRALEELADLFPAEFERLENGQREREGLPPVQRRTNRAAS